MKENIYILLIITAIAGCVTKQPVAQNGLTELKIINARNGDLIQSGFLIGTGTGKNLQQIDVKIGNDEFLKAEGTGFWKFKLPTAREGWKQGEFKTVTVRGMDQQGNISTEITLKIAKGVNRDLNGDGFPDLVMGDHLFDNTRGAAFIYHGDNQGIPVPVTGKKADKTISGKTKGGHFGHTIAVEDFNQDGYGDIVISKYGNDKAVQAYVYPGSKDGIDEPVIKTVLSNQDRTGYFGVKFLVGDLNLKGFLKFFVRKKDNKKQQDIPVEINEK